MLPPIPLLQARINALVARWRKDGIADMPSVINVPSDDGGIDDGGGYGDPFRDERPDFLKATDIPGMSAKWSIRNHVQK